MGNSAVSCVGFMIVQKKKKVKTCHNYKRKTYNPQEKLQLLFAFISVCGAKHIAGLFRWRLNAGVSRILVFLSVK